LRYGSAHTVDGFWWFHYANLDSGYALGLGTGTRNASLHYAAHLKGLVQPIDPM